MVRTADVSDHAVDAVCDVLREAGKKPIVVKKDVPGFIANRMQNALGREAVSIMPTALQTPRTWTMPSNTASECAWYHRPH